MNVAVVGYGLEGADSYRYFAARDDTVTVCDRNSELQLPTGAQAQLGETYLDDLDRFDLIVRTAGMHPQLLLDKNPAVTPKITTQLNEFLRVCPSRQTIAITGTKGKGTTTMLIAKMLEAASQQVVVGGNIGIPLFSLLPSITETSWVVLELSSFQLIDVRYSPHIGVCVMVVPEHLNWHRDMAEYLQAKSNMFAHQTPDDIAVYYAGSDNSRQIAGNGAGQKIPYYEDPGATVAGGMIRIADLEVCSVEAIQLLGKHNWQNACAAVTAVWNALQPSSEAAEALIQAMRSVLTSFSGLEHHIELVRELAGIAYYDDSFGTTPETAMVAIEAFNQPKVIILGGSDKGASYDDLAQTIAQQNVRQVVLIGEQADRIRTALQAVGFKDFVDGGANMPAIVAMARGVAQPGDVILLSPACASFDLFPNYKERGNQFKAAVQALV